MLNRFVINLDKSNWELLVGSKAPAEPGVADGALDAEDMLCVAPVVTLVEGKVVGTDMTCVCRRGNRNACKQTNLSAIVQHKTPRCPLSITSKI